jgi:hypothetical protein
MIERASGAAGWRDEALAAACFGGEADDKSLESRHIGE